MFTCELSILKRVALSLRNTPSKPPTLDELVSTADPSPGTVESCVKSLSDEGLLRSQRTGYGLTEAGWNRLFEEYTRYRTLFDPTDDVVLAGTVTSGLGEGEQFVRLDGYRRQFQEKLGYDPYPGTFNVVLWDASVAERTALDEVPHVDIDGWKDSDRSFGPVYCYPATVQTVDGESYDDAHVVVPERTDHGADQLELLAGVSLRDELGVEDGDSVLVSIER